MAVSADLSATAQRVESDNREMMIAMKASKLALESSFDARRSTTTIRRFSGSRATRPAAHRGHANDGVAAVRIDLADPGPNSPAANDDPCSMQREAMIQSLWQGIAAISGDRAILLVGSQRRVIRASTTACDAIASSAGLTLSEETLGCSRPADEARLDAAIAACLRGYTPDGAVLRIDQGSTGRPLFATIRALAHASAALDVLQPAVLVTIVSPGVATRVNPELLILLFKLTAREADVTDLMVRGHSVESAAATLQISLPTTRTHLRSIFQKTGTDRQSELIRLLNRVN